MNRFMPIPIMLYFSTLLVAIFLPASPGYDHILWKLLIGNIYAIPVLLIATSLLYIKEKISVK